MYKIFRTILAYLLLGLASLTLLYLSIGDFRVFRYTRQEVPNGSKEEIDRIGPNAELGTPIAVREEIFVTHISTPESLKAVYMTQCVVGTKWFRDSLVELVEQTELNSIIIDIKDYTGTLAFNADNSAFDGNALLKCGAKDMKDFIELLHEKDIYVIGRVTVFQDPHYTELYPELAVKKASATTSIWRDHKGLAFIDVGAKPYWDYIVEISKEAYKIGFDEINYDYIRYPSDGPMKDIYYPWSHGKDKVDMLEEFFAYLDDNVSKIGVVTSADLFGMTMTNADDLNIGQVLERAIPYFDYIAPMVYPSHYPKGFMGYSAPATEPYDIVKISMDSGVGRIKGYMRAASTSEAVISGRISPRQLRPWLQDFDLGAVYTADKVRAQMQAVYDAGLTGWMLWDPANTYTKEALLSASSTNSANQTDKTAKELEIEEDLTAP